MFEPLVPMFLPILGAHMSGVEFQYTDLICMEPNGIMAIFWQKVATIKAN